MSQASNATHPNTTAATSAPIASESEKVQAFFSTCQEPYTLAGGHVRARRKLNTRVPESLIPQYIFRLQKALETGEVSASKNRTQWYDARALVRRYGLSVPSARKEKPRDQKEYQRQWRQNHPNYFAERRQRLRAAACAHSVA